MRVRWADFRQSSGQAEPFLLRAGEAHGGNFINAKSRFNESQWLLSRPANPKMTVLSGSARGGSAAGAGARAPPRAADGRFIKAVYSNNGRFIKAAMAVLSTGSGQMARSLDLGCGWPISYCPVQAVYQRPSLAIFSKDLESKWPFYQGRPAAMADGRFIKASKP